jgi:hypothetical protein
MPCCLKRAFSDQDIEQFIERAAEKSGARKRPEMTGKRRKLMGRAGPG